MELRSFPMDRQSCPLILGSCKYTYHLFWFKHNIFNLYVVQLQITLSTVVNGFYHNDILEVYEYIFLYKDREGH